MLSWDEMEIQSLLDAYVSVERPLYLWATDTVVMGSVGYDPDSAEKVLMVFKERHQDDVDIVSRNPLQLKIFDTFYGRSKR